MERPELRRLPAVARVLGLGFLVSLGLAYAVALLFVFVQTDMRPRGIADQYRGNTEAAVGGSEAEAGGSEAGDAEEPGEGPASLAQEWRAHGREMKFAKSLKDMILTTHLHMLSISAILLLVGSLFACSSFPERAKPWVIACGFAGLVLTYASMWLVRYGSAAFGPCVFLSGTLQALSLTTQMLSSLRDLLRPLPTPAPTDR